MASFGKRIQVGPVSLSFLQYNSTKLIPSHGFGFLFLKGKNKKTFLAPFHQHGHTAPHAVPYIPFWTKVNKALLYSNKTLSNHDPPPHKLNIKIQKSPLAKHKYILFISIKRKITKLY